MSWKKKKGLAAAVILLEAAVHQRQAFCNGLQISPSPLVHPATSRRLSSSSLFASAAMEIPTTVEWQRVQLDSGVEAEVAAAVVSDSKKSPLIFLHGSFHASWCWTEHYFPFFTSRGHSCFALSFRGTGGTFAGEGVRRVKIDQHVDDTLAFLNHVQQQQQGEAAAKPILVSHSFGGLAIMKLLERPLQLSRLAGIVVLCSVPPSGNGRMTLRFLRRSLSDSYKITAGLAMKKCNTNPALCRELFFDDTISDSDLSRYMSYFARDTVATIDLSHLSRNLPSEQREKDTGVANFLVEAFRDNDKKVPKILVAGATDDFIVDQEGVQETALYFGWKEKTNDNEKDDKEATTTTFAMIDSPHDVMLGSRWRNGANYILEWMEHNGLG